ncbi:MAG: hypothetical protein U9Q71_06915, partial [Pseudomonadota bacterium]|nr:hypothetical protein [Pseudomonadota bacterium]
TERFSIENIMRHARTTRLGFAYVVFFGHAYSVCRGGRWNNIRFITVFTDSFRIPIVPFVPRHPDPGRKQKTDFVFFVSFVVNIFQRSVVAAETLPEHR